MRILRLHCNLTSSSVICSMYFLKFCIKHNLRYIHLCKYKRISSEICVCCEGSVYEPSQWEMALQCNAISHWLGAYTEWSLYCYCIWVWNTSPVASGQVETVSRYKLLYPTDYIGILEIWLWNSLSGSLSTKGDCQLLEIHLHLWLFVG